MFESQLPHFLALLVFVSPVGCIEGGSALSRARLDEVGSPVEGSPEDEEGGLSPEGSPDPDPAAADTNRDEPDSEPTDPGTGTVSPAAGDPGTGTASPAEGEARFIRVETVASPSWVAWSEVEVYVAGMNIAPGAQLRASSEEEPGRTRDAVDGDPSTGWNSGDFAPASFTVDLGQAVPVDRVRIQVQQMPAGVTTHNLLFGSDEEVFEPVYQWHGETRNGDWLEFRFGPDDVPGTPPPAGVGGILDPQRDPFWARGEVQIQGNRFVVEGQAYYPKTDFLTPVWPGDDVVGWNTLNYLAYDAAKREVIRNAMVAHRYNSMYVYTLTEGVDFMGGGQAVTPYGTGGFSFDTGALNRARVDEWKRAIEELIAHDIKPIIWLAGDDSHTIASKPFGDWQIYAQHMVDAFEAYPILWVVGLEADEYWSPEQVVQRTRDLQGRTRHPVGVHLTITETTNPRSPYTEDADFVMGQLHSPQSDADYVAQVRTYHLADRPWVASEFNVFDAGGEGSVTARSNAIGRVIAGVGNPPLVAGLGNGVDLVGSGDPVSAPPPDDPPPDAPAGGDIPFDLAEVTWLHTDVAGWAVTANLSSVTFGGGQICMEYDKKNVWAIEHVGENNVEIVANPWILMPHEGRWYAATWEWLRPGQTCKAMSSVAGDHIKQRPFDAASGWRPTSGQTYYIMVSAPARLGQWNVAERSNIVAVVWP